MGILLIRCFNSSLFNLVLFFLILILLTYSITIVYGYVFKPVLIPRYIIFILVPILFLISNFVFNIKNKTLKFIFLLILVLPTFLNHFTENTFKQFYTKIYPSKPEIGKMFLHMDKMNIFNYSFVINNDNQPLSLFYMGAPYKNYLEKYSIKISQNFKYINYNDEKTLPKDLCLIYITDVTNEKFKIPVEFKNYLIKTNLNFNHIELYCINKK